MLLKFQLRPMELEMSVRGHYFEKFNTIGSYSDLVMEDE